MELLPDVMPNFALKKKLAKFCTKKKSLVPMKNYTLNSKKNHLENTCYTTTLWNVLYNKTIKRTTFFQLAKVSVDTFLWQSFLFRVWHARDWWGEVIRKKNICDSVVEGKPWKTKGELRLLGWMSCNKCLLSVTVIMRITLWDRWLFWAQRKRRK